MVRRKNRGKKILKKKDDLSEQDVFQMIKSQGIPCYD